MTRVVNVRKEFWDVYIGRSLFGYPEEGWGNPFRFGTRQENIEGYERWIRKQPELLARLPELRGKVLGCWCKPKACHGDVLMKLMKERGIE